MRQARYRGTPNERCRDVRLDCRHACAFSSHRRSGTARRISTLAAPGSPIHENKPFPGIATLRRRAKRSGTALIEFAERARPSQILRGDYRKPYSMSAAAPLVQGVNHATEHRTQIATALTQIGIEPPSIDGWAYARASGLLRWTDAR